MLIAHKHSSSSVRNCSLVVIPKRESPTVASDSPQRAASVPLLSLPPPPPPDDDVKRAMVAALSPRTPRVHTPRPLYAPVILADIEAAFSPEYTLPPSPRVSPVETHFLGTAEPQQPSEPSQRLPARSYSLPPERVPPIHMFVMTPEQPSVRMSRGSVLEEMTLTKDDQRSQSPLIPVLESDKKEPYDGDRRLLPHVRNSARFRELELCRLDSARRPISRATMVDGLNRKDMNLIA